MKQLYKSIQNVFKQPESIAVFHSLGLAPPEYIDLYNGQPESPDDFEFTTPAIFIDYAIDWDQAGTMRRGKITLELHVVTDPTPEVDNLSEPLGGLDKIDYYETVSDLLEGLATGETSGLVLKSERPIATDYFNYHLLTFTCTISRRRTNLTTSVIDRINVTPQNKTYQLD